MLSVVTDEAARSELTMSLDALAREGARTMLAAALEAEVDAYIAAFAEQVGEHGHRLVRRNGPRPSPLQFVGLDDVSLAGGEPRNACFCFCLAGYG